MNMVWNLDQLSVFRAIARYGTFTRGASEAGISQPAASKQIADLERTLGVSVFDRGSRKATLTEAGALLLTYVDRIAGVTTEAEAALADLASLRRGRLRLGATPTLGAYLLPKTLVYFRARYPDIQVTVDIQPAGRLLGRFNEGALDVMLSARQPHGDSGRPFMIDRYQLVCAASHSLAAVKRLSLEALAGQRWIVRDGPRGSPGYVERMLRARRCRPASMLRLPTAESVRQAVLAGVGVAFLPGIVAQDDLAVGRLRTFGVAGFELRRSYFWVGQAAFVTPRVVTAYACVLKHAVRGSLPPVRK